MSEARLVFLLIVPMFSESWYVRVAKPLPKHIWIYTIHGPTSKHGKTECCPLKKCWLKRAFRKE